MRTEAYPHRSQRRMSAAVGTRPRCMPVLTGPPWNSAAQSGWPGGLLEWDCLFLIPKPWYGPVLAPVLISIYFALACWWLHACEVRGKPMRFSMVMVLSQLAAFVVWYWSFVSVAFSNTRAPNECPARTST